MMSLSILAGPALLVLFFFKKKKEKVRPQMHYF